MQEIGWKEQNFVNIPDIGVIVLRHTRSGRGRVALTIVVATNSTSYMYHSSPLVAHHSGSFGILWTGDTDHTTWSTEKYTVNEPLGHTTGTFFGKIQGVPIDYLISTSWSHDLEHWDALTVFCKQATWAHHGIFSWIIQDVPMDYLIGTPQLSGPLYPVLSTW